MCRREYGTGDMQNQMIAEMTPMENEIKEKQELNECIDVF